MILPPKKFYIGIVSLLLISVFLLERVIKDLIRISLITEKAEHVFRFIGHLYILFYEAPVQLICLFSTGCLCISC